VSPEAAPRRWPADPAALDALHAELDRTWVDHPDVAPGDRTAVALAVSELVANAIEHGGARWLWVRVEVDDLAVVVVLEDDGRPTPRRIASEVVSADPLAESGRGMALARLVAELSHERRGDRNRWRVVRRRLP
jgi:anti-sigma regulatory factor (Ser/Thr protein kinase)